MPHLSAVQCRRRHHRPHADERIVASPRSILDYIRTRLYLRISGGSMAGAGICDGDLVECRLMYETPSDGSIVLVWEETVGLTVKKFLRGRLYSTPTKGSLLEYTPTVGPVIVGKVIMPGGVRAQMIPF